MALILTLSAACAQERPFLVQLTRAQSSGQIFRLLAALSPADALWSQLPCLYPVGRPLWTRSSSGYGYRIHPVLRHLSFHQGLDLPAREGAPVMVVADGVVRQVGQNALLGCFVKVRHLYGFESTYGHLRACSVRPGQILRQGRMVGLAGSTGRTTGPHLHYGLSKNGLPQDPYPYCNLLSGRLSRARALR